MLIDGKPIFEKEYDSSLHATLEALHLMDGEKPDGYMGDKTAAQIALIKLQMLATGE